MVRSLQPSAPESKNGGRDLQPACDCLIYDQMNVGEVSPSPREITDQA